METNYERRVSDFFTKLLTFLSFLLGFGPLECEVLYQLRAMTSFIELSFQSKDVGTHL